MIDLHKSQLSDSDPGETAEWREALDEIPGAQLERKHFSVAAHYRNVSENDAPRVGLAVDAVGAKHRELRRMDGKKVYELLHFLVSRKIDPAIAKGMLFHLYQHPKMDFDSILITLNFKVV
ncbi:MAG: hypothetical protein HGA90_06895, partial [Alphaproteobacteria bacterium]|nr:hypothetical protein [Alphaproteobacteria bacterium]